ncbi:unnamed protein product [Staurois parvus]|uniref:Uncharacterized protein n=1 Tax=Staurois parvus TaxID=386267 RepID=A0ABN9FIT4_9NEOB|nr:unnamed protein product [Staurois parvus]
MSTDRWHFWGHTDHQCPDDHCQRDSSRGEKMTITGFSVFTCDQL